MNGVKNENNRKANCKMSPGYSEAPHCFFSGVFMVEFSNTEQPVNATYASLNEAMIDAARFAVSDAASEGIHLDYTWESIEQLEAAIESLFKKPKIGLLGRVFRKKLQSRHTQRHTLAYGAYVAEVIREHYPGSWSPISKLYTGTAKLTFCTDTGIELWPHERIMRRVMNGPEDNLWHYLQGIERHIEHSRA